MMAKDLQGMDVSIYAIVAVHGGFFFRKKGGRSRDCSCLFARCAEQCLSLQVQARGHRCKVS
jgi:hypothetical protein